MPADICSRRPFSHLVGQTSAAVLMVDSYATIRRSVRRTAAVVTRVRRDFVKREVDFIRRQIKNPTQLIRSTRLICSALLTSKETLIFSIDVFFSSFI